MWSFYIAGGLKIRSFNTQNGTLGPKSSGLIIEGGLKIKGCKIEGLLYIENGGVTDGRSSNGKNIECKVSYSQGQLDAFRTVLATPT